MLSELMKKNGITSMQKPKTADVIRITREEYNLLDYKDSSVIYYIEEPNNTITMMKGAN